MSDPAVLNTILKPIYGAKEEAVSGLCLHCVHCNKLASIDHLATNSLLTPVGLTTQKRNRFLEWTTSSKPYVHHLFPLSLCEHLLFVLLFPPPTEFKSQMGHWDCLSVTVQLFIIQSNQHLHFSFYLIWHSTSAFTCLTAMTCSYLPMNKSLPHNSL